MFVHKRHERGVHLDVTSLNIPISLPRDSESVRDPLKDEQKELEKPSY